LAREYKIKERVVGDSEKEVQRASCSVYVQKGHREKLRSNPVKGVNNRRGPLPCLTERRTRGGESRRVPENTTRIWDCAGGGLSIVSFAQALYNKLLPVAVIEELEAR